MNFRIVVDWLDGSQGIVCALHSDDILNDRDSDVLHAALGGWSPEDVENAAAFYREWWNGVAWVRTCDVRKADVLRLLC